MFIALVFGIELPAVAQIPVGTWRDHLSFNEVVSITFKENSIIAAANSGIFEYDPIQNEVSKTTGLDGLSDANITQIGYSIEKQTLIIAYQSGNIDIIRENSLTNFTELFNNDRIDDKEINHILFEGDLAYLSGAFGILIIDLQSLTVKDSFLGLGADGATIAVNGTAILGDSIYAATTEGIMSGALSDNLKDFNKWRRYTLADNVPEGEGTAIANIGNELLVGVGINGLVKWNNNSWSQTGLLIGEEVHSITNTERTVITSASGQYEFADNTLANLTTSLANGATSGVYALGSFWFGSAQNGLVLPGQSQNQAIYPQGPVTNNIVKLVEAGGRIVALPPAYSESLAPMRNYSGMSIFGNEEWTNFRYNAVGSMINLPEFPDITDGEYDETNEKWYFSSFGYGLLTYQSDVFEIIDENTPGSPLENTNPPGRNVFITSLTLKSSDLSILNYRAETPLHKLSFDGAWTSFKPTFTNANQATELLSTPWGDHWLVLSPASGGGIIVYNEDGRTKYLNDVAGAGGLPDNKIYDIILDREGKVWVATEKGVVYYPFPDFILSESVVDPVIPIFDFNQLFVNQPVTALAADGGNRIWMATRQGVWLFANDGQELIREFNTGNSPLLANAVTSIALDNRSGEVFFATEDGLISYRGEATSGIEASEVKIFPNPVTPDFSGVITLEGVPENSLIYITDASGRLAYRAMANGNSATWDGRLSSNGGRAPAGVYLVFVSDENKSRKQVGKIVLIN